MIQLKTQTYGNSLAVGISGDSRDEILHQYYSFYNLKATGGKFHWVTDSFGFFLTNQTKFDKWIVDSSKRIYANSVQEIKSVAKAKKAILKIIEQRKKDIINKVFLPKVGEENAFRAAGVKLSPTESGEPVLSCTVFYE